MQERYSGRRRAIAFSMAEPSSFDSISSRADSSSLAMSNEVASTSAALPACGEPLIEIVAIWRRRR